MATSSRSPRARRSRSTPNWPATARSAERSPTTPATRSTTSWCISTTRRAATPGCYTGDDGDFAFTSLAPGDYTIFFDNGDPLYTDEWWQDAAGQEDADPITLGDGAAVALPTAHITTAPAGAISGTVRDAETLTGLEGVTATLQRDDGYTYYAYADAAGHYGFAEVPNGTYTLHFQNPGGIDWYLDEWWDDASSADSATPIVVAGGADLTLQRRPHPVSRRQPQRHADEQRGAADHERLRRRSTPRPATTPVATGGPTSTRSATTSSPVSSPVTTRFTSTRRPTSTSPSGGTTSRRRAPRTCSRSATACRRR